MCSLHSLPTPTASSGSGGSGSGIGEGVKKSSGETSRVDVPPLDDVFVPCTGAPGYTCSSRFNNCLQRLGPLHAYLQQQVDVAVAFERKITDALQAVASREKALSQGASSSSSSALSTPQARIPFLQELYRSMGHLVVQPEITIRKALEKALGGHVPAPPEGQPRYSYADTDHDGDYENRAGGASKKLKTLSSGGKSSTSGGGAGSSRGDQIRDQKSMMKERDQLLSVAPWGEGKAGGKKRPLSSTGQDKTGPYHIFTRHITQSTTLFNTPSNSTLCPILSYPINPHFKQAPISS